MENVYAEPYITKEVHFDQDHKENIVDIYVSAESLRVYENPWVEGMSPNTSGLGGTQHSGMDTTSMSNKHYMRVDIFCSYFLYLHLGVCLLCFVWVW